MFFTLTTYPIFPKKVLSVSRCHYIFTYTFNNHRRNCGEIILGLAILNMSLRFLQVLSFLMAPAAFRSHAETSLCICMHACMYVWMHVWMYAWICGLNNRVLNEICTQFGMLRYNIYVVVFLGEFKQAS